jgi:hypothetical protein
MWGWDSNVPSEEIYRSLGHQVGDTQRQQEKEGYEVGANVWDPEWQRLWSPSFKQQSSWHHDCFMICVYVWHVWLCLPLRLTKCNILFCAMANTNLLKWNIRVMLITVGFLYARMHKAGIGVMKRKALHLWFLVRELSPFVLLCTFYTYQN